MIYADVANLQQAVIVLYQAKTATCENKIVLLFVTLFMLSEHPKTTLSQHCVAIIMLVSAKHS